MMIEYLNFGFWFTGLVVFILGRLSLFVLICWKLIDYVLRQTGLMVPLLQAMRRMYQEKRDKETING
jgi:hypothetical protein